jgi:hypothetical protein
MEQFRPNCKMIATEETRLVELIPQQVVDGCLCTGLGIDALDDYGTGQIGAGAAIRQGLSGDRAWHHDRVSGHAANEYLACCAIDNLAG